MEPRPYAIGDDDGNDEAIAGQFRPFDLAAFRDALTRQPDASALYLTRAVPGSLTVYGESGPTAIDRALKVCPLFYKRFADGVTEAAGFASSFRLYKAPLRTLLDKSLPEAVGLPAELAAAIVANHPTARLLVLRDEEGELVLAAVVRKPEDFEFAPMRAAAKSKGKLGADAMQSLILGCTEWARCPEAAPAEVKGAKTPDIAAALNAVPAAFFNYVFDELYELGGAGSTSSFRRRR